MEKLSELWPILLFVACMIIGARIMEKLPPRCRRRGGG